MEPVPPSIVMHLGSYDRCSGAHGYPRCSSCNKGNKICEFVCFAKMKEALDDWSTCLVTTRAVHVSRFGSLTLRASWYRACSGHTRTVTQVQRLRSEELCNGDTEQVAAVSSLGAGAAYLPAALGPL
ncbi:hypothetical protein ANN_16948 [Periplaneta americana]|uniref:Uncharacterized protein n=1 Tax=Periplaneta americana TaxID=6978 RepID=A0ABQ8SSV7_PERAM|nr:hypothetical protein ANN_16948 [Periplaneta americana]